MMKGERITMNGEPPETVGQHSIGDPHNGIEAVCREIVVGHDPQAQVLRRMVTMSREPGGRSGPMPVAEPVSAVIAIYEAIVYAGDALIGKSRSRAHEVFVVDFMEPGRVKR